MSKLLSTLNDINWQVNNFTTYLRDSGDFWQMPCDTEKRGAGDCEDMAALKLQKIIQAGYNGYLARVQLHINGRMTGHMICCVDAEIKKGFFRKKTC